MQYSLNSINVNVCGKTTTAKHIVFYQKSSNIDLFCRRPQHSTVSSRTRVHLPTTLALGVAARDEGRDEGREFRGVLLGDFEARLWLPVVL